MACVPQGHHPRVWLGRHLVFGLHLLAHMDRTDTTVLMDPMGITDRTDRWAPWVLWAPWARMDQGWAPLECPRDPHPLA